MNPNEFLEITASYQKSIVDKKQRNIGLFFYYNTISNIIICKH
jgi:hypothetical protein